MALNCVQCGKSKAVLLMVDEDVIRYGATPTKAGTAVALCSLSCWRQFFGPRKDGLA